MNFSDKPGFREHKAEFDQSAARDQLGDFKPELAYTDPPAAIQNDRSSPDLDLFQTVPIGIVYQDRSGRIISANPAAERILGLSLDQMQGRTSVDSRWRSVREDGSVFPGEEHPAMEALRTGREVRNVTMGVYHPETDTQRWININAVPQLRYGEGTPYQVYTVFEDVTEQRRVEAALRESEQLYRSLYSSMSEGMCLYELVYGDGDKAVDYRILVVNPAFERIVGIPRQNAVGQLATKLYGTEEPPFLDKYAEVARTGRPARFETHFEPLGKHFAITAFSPRADRFATVFTDITEQRERQARLRQSEKMQAMGQLAGGVAHDFNNILSGIMGYADLCRLDAPDDSALAKNLDHILAASDRARDLVNQILTFSRQGSGERQLGFLKPIVEEVLGLLRASIPSTITITADLEEDTRPVLVDHTRIHEVIMNLCTNAAHAMSETGELFISLKEEQLSQEKSGVMGVISRGCYSVIEVRDTGQGIDSAIIDRIFEPFFTTKAPDKGAGMGLSVVYGVVQAHDGNLQVESRPGAGSTFRVFIPTAETLSTPVNGHHRRSQPSPDITGTEHILFVDDEPMLTSLAEQMLRSLGYRVTTTNNGHEALDVLAFRADDIDVLVTDQTMPDITGVDLSTAALRIKPDLPIVLCTGYSTCVDKDLALATGISKFCMKPVSRNEIGEAIRQAIHKNKRHKQPS